MAAMLAHSRIVPENYRGDEHLADCVIALEIANRNGVSVMAVMQNLYIIQGKPVWSSQFLISCLNATKRFSPLRYEMTGTRGQDDRGCVAWAMDQHGEDLKSPEVTIKTAKAEGWFDRVDSKWKTMPELMLRYRSAALFVRLFAPEISMGIGTAEEAADIVTPEVNGKPYRRPCRPRTIKPQFSSSPASVPGQTQPLRPSAEMTSRKDGDEAPPGAVEDLVSSIQRPALSKADSALATYNYVKALQGLIALSSHDEAELMSFLRNTGKCHPDRTTLVEVMDKQPDAIIWAHDNWQVVDRELAQCKGQAV